MIRVGPSPRPVSIDLTRCCFALAGTAVCTITIPHVPQNVKHNVRAAHDGDAGGELGNERQGHLLRMRGNTIERGHF